MHKIQGSSRLPRASAQQVSLLLLYRRSTLANPNFRGIRTNDFVPSSRIQCILLRQIRTAVNQELWQIQTHLSVPSSKNHCFYSGKSRQQQMICDWMKTDLLLVYFLCLILFFQTKNIKKHRNFIWKSIVFIRIMTRIIPVTTFVST